MTNSESADQLRREIADREARLARYVRLAQRADLDDSGRLVARLAVRAHRDAISRLELELHRGPV